jgi:dihydroorotase/N-acyl-D-amino-acid deacylase
VAGNKLGALLERELQAMEGLLADALSAGAVGFSTGLMYAPGSSAPFEELERLCRVVARYDKIYTSHIRGYFSDLVESVKEQIELARRAGCRLQISHLQAVGAANWSRQAQALDRIERARQEGLDVAFDCYPYVAGSTVLTQALPQWVLGGGIEGMMARLTDAGERARIAAEINAKIEWRWGDIFISAAGGSPSVVGHHLAELGEERGCAPVDVMLDLLIAERGAVNMLCFNQSEENLRQTLTHPLSNIISDGFYVKGRPHPRLHGTFPFLLGTVCRGRGWMPLEQAIHKITGRPAERYRIRDRGRIAAGCFADLAVFDAGVIDSPATYETPELPPVGIRYVFRNGELLEES